MDRGGEHVIHSALLCSLLLDGDSECQDRLWNKTLYWGTSTNKYLPSYSIWVYHIPNLPTVSAIGDESWVVVGECRISLNDPSYNQPHHGRSRRYMSNDVSDFCIWFSHIILGLVRHQCQGLFEYVHILTMHDECVSHLTCIWCMLCRVEVGMNIGPLPFIHVAKSALSYLIQRFTAALV